MRVTPDCNLNGAPFYVTQSTNKQWQPDIAYGGGNYLVVWADARSMVEKDVIYASRLTPSGSVLDPGGIQLGTADTLCQWSPAVAYTDSKFFVAWGYYSAPYRILGRFVYPDGSLGDTIRVANMSNYTYAWSAVRVAYSGSNILVTWSETIVPYSTYHLKGQLLSTSGALVGGPFTIATPIYDCALGLCFDGTNYFVTYTGPMTYLYGRKINKNGNPLDAPFRISSSGNSQKYMDVVPGANNRYFNVWTDQGADLDIHGNLDVLITNVAEQNRLETGAIVMKSRIVRDAIILENAQGIETQVFDIVGNRVGVMNNGYFDCRHLGKGIYFIKIAGEEYRVIKL